MVEVLKDVVKEVEFWLGLVFVVHLILVFTKGYEKIIFFLSGYFDFVRVVIEKFLQILIEAKVQKVRDVLKEVGLFYYVLVEKWGEREGKKGDEKFEKFLELIKSTVGEVEKWEEDGVREEAKRFADVVNFIQKNTSAERFIERAGEVENMIKSGVKIKVLGKIVLLFLKIFGLR